MDEQRIEPQYNEWVLPNWSSFIPLLGIFPALWLTFLPINLFIGIWSGIGVTLLVGALMVAKSARIVVTPDQLQVSNAKIDRRFVSGVTVIEKAEAFAARGRDLNPRAWIHFQGSIAKLALVEINDPEDPTPYWLFSTRNPEKLKAILGF
jgi:hypothetical protein